MSDNSTMLFYLKVAGIFIPALEGFIGILIFILNVYSIKTLWNKATYHANFRRTFSGCTLIIGFIHLSHPISTLYCPETDSLAKGHIRYAVFQYLMFIITNISTIFLHIKFFLLIWERRVAFRRRETYEHEVGSLPFKILGTGFIFIIVEIITRTICYHWFCPELTEDEKMQYSMSIETSTNSVCAAYICFYLSVALELMFFHYLSSAAKFYRFKCRSLSESFELRQTAHISHILQPVVYAYLVCAIFMTPGWYVAMRTTFDPTSAFWLAWNEVAKKYAYICIAFYSLFSAAYFIRIFNSKSEIVIKSECPRKVCNDHFRYLVDSWETDKKSTV